MTADLLDLGHVSVRYGDRPALRDVSLRVGPGELVALAGPNGSGKSTLLRAAAGLERPEGGRVLLGGADLKGLSLKERALRVGWMPQEEPWGDDLPVLDYVRYGRHPHLPPLGSESPDDLEEVERALEMVGAAEFRDRRVWSLSGGERQRVRLARVLAQRAPLVLLDEPTAHLDVGHQLDVLERVRAAARSERIAVVAALHDLNLAARFASRVAVLAHGRMVADGGAADVLSEELLARVWGVEADLRRDPATGVPFFLPRRLLRPPSATLTGVGPVHVVGGGGAASPYLRRLVDAGFELTVGSLHLLDTDLETAEALSLATAVEVPFAPLGEEVRARNRTLLRAARAVVVTPFAVGPANLANLEDLRESVRAVPTLLVREPSIGARDFTGGRATEVYEELRRLGAREVADPDEVVARLEELLRRTPSGTPAAPEPSDLERGRGDPGERAQKTG